jgi:cytochrome c oxidase subunit 3/cytochrome o ubiquinol oxidase subunit 3
LAQAVATVQQAHGGAGHEGVQGPGHHPPTSTGLDHRKLLMWTFLGSDCMFFGSLIATFLIYREETVRLINAGQAKGPSPREILDIPYTSISAGVLLFSSLTMVLALAAIQRGEYRGTRIWLLATVLLGSTFLGGQYFEFTSFYHEGLGLTTNMFGTTFFVLTGFHGAHVTIGVIWLTSLLIVSLRGGLKQDQAFNVEIAGLYWHFVDIVWVIIFTIVYLIPYDKVSTAKESGEQALRLLGIG